MTTSDYNNDTHSRILPLIIGNYYLQSPGYNCFSLCLEELSRDEDRAVVLAELYKSPTCPMQASKPTISSLGLFYILTESNLHFLLAHQHFVLPISIITVL